MTSLDELIRQKGLELRREIEHATLEHVRWWARPPRRRKRIVLTFGRKGYETPRLQSLARLQPTRFLDNGHVEHESSLRAGLPFTSLAPRSTRRFLRRYHGSHSQDILRVEYFHRMLPGLRVNG